MPGINRQHNSRILSLSVCVSHGSVAKPIDRYENTDFTILKYEILGRQRLKCYGTRAETRFRLSAKRTSPFKSAGGISSVDYWQASCAHRDSNAGYTMFRGSVKVTGYPLHSPVSPSLSLPLRHRVPSHFQTHYTPWYIGIWLC